jgi:DNA-binding winged helix-turn-helix (wHTH) protein
MALASDHAFGVGEWLVKPAELLLCKNGRQVRIQPKAMDVLVYLASRADEVVSRQALFENVWAGTFVSDVALARVISDLRKALGESGRDADPILKTIPKRGYLLTRVNFAAEPAAHAGFADTALPEPMASKPSRNRYALRIALALTLLMPIIAHDWHGALHIWRMHALTLSIFTSMFLLARSTMWAVDRVRT